MASSSPEHRYILFLRGINVDKKQVKMETLKKMLEKLGYVKVQTFLNSGNVVVSTSENERAAVRKRVEKALAETFGFSIAVIVRTDGELQALLTDDPFAALPVTTQTHLYVTFLSTPPLPSEKLPSHPTVPEFQLVRVTDGDICSALTLSDSVKTPEAMSILEKTYGKSITTRNWNTLVRIGKTVGLA